MQILEKRINNLYKDILKLVMKIENRENYKRGIFCIIFVCLILVAYVAKLVDWQIINGEEFFLRANMGRVCTIKTDAVRGEILDVNGVNFTTNKTSYRIVLDRFLINKEKEDETIFGLMDLIKLKQEEWIDELPIIINEKGEFCFKEDKDKEIAELKGKNRLNLNSYATAEDCMKKLANDLNYTDIDLKKNRDLLSIKYNMLRKGYFRSTSEPYVFAQGVSKELVTIISEKYQNIPGIRVELFAEREINMPSLAPHILGTVGQMSQEKYEKVKERGYSIDDIIGQSGIEAIMEEYLRGKSGEKMIELSYEGELKGTLKTKSAAPGNTVFLTIDSRLQEVANKALETQIKMVQANAGVSGKGFDCKAGGVVALNVKDFSVLAAATYPGYDAVKLTSDSEYYKQIMEDKALPLYDRALIGSFAPGSVFKPLVAAGALQENVVTETEKISCYQRYFYPGTNFSNTCLHTHGPIDVVRALEQSCNIYFSEAGRRLGIENMNSYCKKFGLGVKTGIELNETAGVIAGPEHSKALGSSWNNLVTIKAAIGQSDNLFSPLQLATYTATIANGGNRYRPHFIRKIMDYKKENIIMENNPDSPEFIENCGISEVNLNIVKKGMRQVVLNGTATLLNSLPFTVAGKTGTAQNSGSNHKAFICFAPYENPEIAIGVLIEHGHYGSVAINVAKEILQAYFANKQQ